MTDWLGWKMAQEVSSATSSMKADHSDPIQWVGPQLFMTHSLHGFSGAEAISEIKTWRGHYRGQSNGDVFVTGAALREMIQELQEQCRGGDWRGD